MTYPLFRDEFVLRQSSDPEKAANAFTVACQSAAYTIKKSDGDAKFTIAMHVLSNSTLDDHHVIRSPDFPRSSLRGVLRVVVDHLCKGEPLEERVQSVVVRHGRGNRAPARARLRSRAARSRPAQAIQTL